MKRLITTQRLGGVLAGAALALAALALLASAPQPAPDRYCTVQTNPLYTAPQATASSCGRLELAVPLRVLETSDGWARVQLEGWQLQGSPTVLYALEGVRIREAILDACAQAKLQVLKTVTDEDTGQVWNKVRLAGFWVPEKALSRDLRKPWATAEALYKKNCSACHALHDPAQFTANQWPQVLKSMTSRTPLDKTQIAWITKYLQYHAKGIDPDKVPLPCGLTPAKPKSPPPEPAPPAGSGSR
ncbi:cytochrome c-type protein TorC [Oceanithermus profundus DSM 14977]|uniref:Cytochrome c-type protein TorC n=1 Tax=Oceanithermus profundus (strain DSM 14977 / NBRC 100410 / VKM B-2274 / 506) TaxID=670487 RepID=E4U5E9_OCEP5|nr:cytochrome c-type protein torc [Oceanithermus profundus]ADR37623.1 cytochrome c-type protein TorC [Oceanithermus profundus DSM 14977]